MLARRLELDPDAVEFMVGHAPATVASKHYLDRLDLAIKEYPKIVKELKKLIPP